MIMVQGTWGRKQSSEMMEGATHSFSNILMFPLQRNKELSFAWAQEEEAQLQLNK